MSVINDGSFSEHALVKVRVNDPGAAVDVSIAAGVFSGFDGMVVTSEAHVLGITNDGGSPGGNVLRELTGNSDWTSANVERSKSITASTTVAVTPGDRYFVINQDFADANATTWTIESIALPAQ